MKRKYREIKKRNRERESEWDRRRYMMSIYIREIEGKRERGILYRYIYCCFELHLY